MTIRDIQREAKLFYDTKEMPDTSKYDMIDTLLFSCFVKMYELFYSNVITKVEAEAMKNTLVSEYNKSKKDFQTFMLFLQNLTDTEALRSKLNKQLKDKEDPKAALATALEIIDVYTKSSVYEPVIRELRME